ncbi:MFS transporter [Glycomyces tarimensis]
MTDPSSTASPRAGRPQLRPIAGRFARFLLVLVAACGALVLSPGGASAQDSSGCSDWEWHNEWERCLDEVADSPEVECAEAPTPSSPDSGMAGWFAEPSRPDKGEGIGQYTRYGYAGYQLPMYASKELSVGGQCIDSLSLPDGADTANALANMEFNTSTAIIGASNSMRQAAWDPQRLWGWSNEFMETGSQAVYSQVFTIFGAVTVGVVGLYLLWRSRQADMNNAVTTTAWAVLILVLVTAVARWPVQAASWADEGMSAGLNLSQGLIEDEAANGCESMPGISNAEYERIKDATRGQACIDTRSAAVKASDMSTGDVLYQNWLRAMLGQGEEATFTEVDGEPVEDSEGNPEVRGANTAYKYGPALYAAQAMSWTENDQSEESTGERADIIEEKQENWRKLATLIQQEDPEAYEHLTGGRAWERTGSGLLALLTALFFSLFDLTASVLIILGFMIVRFAVIALPIIGTVAILRPAGGPFKRLVNIVLAAVINVIVFAVAAVIYLFAADRILGADLPSWMQVMLIGLVGVAAWLLLRPFRRLASFQGAGGPTDALFGRTIDKERHKETEIERRRETTRQGEARPESRSDAGLGRQPERTEGRAAPPEQQPGQQTTSGSRTTAPTPSSSGTSNGGVYTPPRKD